MPSSFSPASFEIACSTGGYDIHIGNELLDRELGGAGERLVIADRFLAGTLAARGIDAILITADEHAKSLDRMGDLIESIKDRQATRNTTLIAIGGGVVQDCVTFVASVYMRGVPWIYIPTTLLSMVDSCIGGKSSINVGRYKNIVGTFHPPRRVVIDPALAQSLSTEQRIAGLSEAVKICMCRGPEAFDAYLALRPSPTMDETGFAAVTELCLRAKKWFIEIDEFDRKERLILNFGHTFGHAIEAASGFAIGHGVAVGLGMLAALNLGETLGHAPFSDPRVTTFRDHIHGLLASVDGLVAHLAACDLDKLMDAFGADKKHGREELAVILVNRAGAVHRIMLPRSEEMLKQVANAFSSLKSIPFAR
ncbi:MAG: 3-dehydroquinate synthase [Novosphingobium sp.]|nr:3-dehydroquinate synthase [Novosphingobium sp.]